MNLFLTKSNGTGITELWTEPPNLCLNGNIVYFSDGGEGHRLQCSLYGLERVFPRIGITADFGMKQLEITEIENGYIIKEVIKNEGSGLNQAEHPA